MEIVSEHMHPYHMQHAAPHQWSGEGYFCGLNRRTQLHTKYNSFCTSLLHPKVYLGIKPNISEPKFSGYKEPTCNVMSVLQDNQPPMANFSGN